MKRKVLRSISNNPGTSDRKRALKIGTSRSMVMRTRHSAGLKSYHAIKVPNRNDKQNINAKKRARKLYDTILTKFNDCLMLDDETYVKIDQKQIPGQKFYISDKRLNVPSKFKYIKLDKFGKKLLIWQAICSCGRKSKSFVTSSTITANLYVKECLEKRLLPFIRSHGSPVIFWPDLASSHYARVSLEWLKSNNVDFVPKELNPPNSPEFRPIEKYWALVKRNLKDTRGTIRNARDMQFMWNKCADKVGEGVVRDMMGSIKTKVRAYIRSKKDEN